MRFVLVALGLSLFGCRSAPVEQPPAERLVFVRGGVLAEAGSGGRGIGGGRELLERGWTPGESVTVGRRTDPAPARPECVPLFHVDLADVRSLVSRGVSAPGTAMAWSPDGSKLAIGSYRGEIVVVDGWTGAELARRQLAEAVVKQIVWSPDGATVYAGEQSPDAFVYALSAADLTTRWSVRLADDLETSPPPGEADVYGLFTLPAAYGVAVLPGGDLIVAGAHAWVTGDDERRNLARILRIDPAGEVVASFPSDAPAKAVFRFPRVDVDGGLLAFPVGYSAAGERPTDLPLDGIQVLNLKDLTPRFQHVGGALEPHFKRAHLWEAVDVDGERALAGFGDGRLQLVPLDGGAVTSLDLGTPVVSGDVPIASSVSWGLFLDDGASAASTGTTNIPWGSDVAASRPPAAHPGENTLWVHGADGALRWNRRMEPAIQGLSVTPNGKRLIVGAGARNSDARRDLFGAYVFRLDGEGSGEERLEVACATESPVSTRHEPLDDGRIAVGEVPWKDEADGAVHGFYRVTVLR
jgi:hypothetical protein